MCLCHVVHAAAFVLALAVAPDPDCCFKGGGLQSGDPHCETPPPQGERGTGALGRAAGLLGARDTIPQTPVSGLQRREKGFDRTLADAPMRALLLKQPAQRRRQRPRQEGRVASSPSRAVGWGKKHLQAKVAAINWQAPIVSPSRRRVGKPPSKQAHDQGIEIWTTAGVAQVTARSSVTDRPAWSRQPPSSSQPPSRLVHGSFSLSVSLASVYQTVSRLPSST